MRPLLAFVWIAIRASVALAGPSDHDNPPPNWLGDTLTPDLTLTASSPGPTYFVYGDVTVPYGVTLTIEPGVTLEFADRSDFFASGSYPDKAELIVDGTLIAQGLDDNRINLRSSRPVHYPAD